MNFSWDVFWQYLLHPSDVYLYGLGLTCVIAIGAMLLGCALGLLAALARLSRYRALQYPVRCYVWLMRARRCWCRSSSSTRPWRPAASFASRTWTWASW